MRVAMCLSFSPFSEFLHSMNIKNKFAEPPLGSLHSQIHGTFVTAASYCCKMQNCFMCVARKQEKYRNKKYEIKMCP